MVKDASQGGERIRTSSKRTNSWASVVNIGSCFGEKQLITSKKNNGNDFHDQRNRATAVIGIHKEIRRRRGKGTRGKGKGEGTKRR
jgi:hypothetical protein